jgi:hypothetical protein
MKQASFQSGIHDSDLVELLTKYIQLHDGHVPRFEIVLLNTLNRIKVNISAPEVGGVKLTEQQTFPPS